MGEVGGGSAGPRDLEIARRRLEEKLERESCYFSDKFEDQDILLENAEYFSSNSEETGMQSNLLASAASGYVKYDDGSLINGSSKGNNHDGGNDDNDNDHDDDDNYKDDDGHSYGDHGGGGVEKGDIVRRRIFLLTAVAAIGGFLFGYDTGVISGAMLLIKEEMNLSKERQEVVVTSTVVACLVGSLVAGPLNAKVGRRPVILSASVIFTVGALIMGFAPSYTALVLGRITVGLGIGFASLTTPIYIAEVAPKDMRGRLVTINTLCVAFGQFLAGMVDGMLSGTSGGWRWMLGLAAVPSVMMFVGFLLLPESPRYLVTAGKKEQAIRVLSSLRYSKREAVEEVDSIVTALIAHEEYSSLGGRTSTLSRVREMVSHAPTRRALTLGCGIMLLQQFTGINTVMYYAATIYETAGFDTKASIWLSGFTALAQVLGIAYSIWAVERSGR